MNLSSDTRGADEAAKVKAARRVAARLAAENLLQRRDPWLPIKWGYVYTEDEKMAGKSRPLEPISYLEWVIRLWQLFNVGSVAKARQMVISWVFAWMMLHGALNNPGSLWIIQGKRKEDIKAEGTKNMMGRILHIWRNLPGHMKPREALLSEEEIESSAVGKDGKRRKARTTMTVMEIPGGGTIIGAPQGPDVIRSRTGTGIFMDEYAFHPKGGAAWNSALPAIDNAPSIDAYDFPWLSKWNDWMKEHRARHLMVEPGAPKPIPSLWNVSTPNGRDENFYTQAPWEDWREWPEISGVTYSTGEKVEGLRVFLKEREWNGYRLPPIACARLHYTAEDKPESWARRRASRASYTSETAYEVENEISFRVVAGKPVFGPGEFTSDHVVKCEVDPFRTHIVSMDAGYQGQAAAFWQESLVSISSMGTRFWRRSHLFDCLLKKQMGISDFLVLIKQRLYQHGIDWQNVRFITDFNTLTTHHGGAGLTDMKFYRDAGINPQARKVGPNQKDQAINLVREALKMWPDGKPGLLVDPRCNLALDMFDGGWRYDEPPPGKGPTETPLKDGTFDHIGDAIVYRFWYSHAEIWDSDMGGLESPIRPDSPAGVRSYLARKTIQRHRGTKKGWGPQNLL